MSRIDNISINMQRCPFNNQSGDGNSANIESLSHHSQQVSASHHHYRSNLHKSSTLTPADIKKLANQNYSGQRRAMRTASVLRKPKAPLPIKNTNFIDDQSLQDHRFSMNHLDSNSSRLSSTLPRNRTTCATIPKSILTASPASLTTSVAAPNYNYQNHSPNQDQKQHDTNYKSNLLRMTPITSIKKFWKLMSRASIDEKKQSSTGCSTTDGSRFSKSEDFRLNSNRLFLSSIGSLGGDSIDGSNSPTMCPPPPDELKSVNYMTSTSKYSNYDEFTRTRNQLSSTLLNHSHSQRRTTKQHLENVNHNIVGIYNSYDNNNIDSKNASCRTRFNNNNHNNFQNNNNNNDYSRPKSDLPQLLSSNQAEKDAWQLSSLPLTYEKNLSTLYEERHNQSDSINDKTLTSDTSTNDFIYGFATRTLQPPSNFEDSTIDKKGLLQHSNGVSDQTDSSQSLNSSNTNDSFIEQQKQNGTKYRFSYGQPRSFQQQQSKVSSKQKPHNNSELSDKLMSISRYIARESSDHLYDEATRDQSPNEQIEPNDINVNSTNLTEHKSNINNENNHLTQTLKFSTIKTNDSLPPRAPGNCDQTRRISQDVIRDDIRLKNTNIIRSNSYRTSLCDNQLLNQKQQQFMANANYLGDSDILNGAQENNSDDSQNTTIISNSSTIRPEPATTDNNTNNTNNNLDITELHKIIENLKSELEAKKKDINDLQMKKWESDCTNYELRSAIGKLEEENAKLKAIVVNSNGRVN